MKAALSTLLRLSKILFMLTLTTVVNVSEHSFESGKNSQYGMLGMLISGFVTMCILLKNLLHGRVKDNLSLSEIMIDGCLTPWFKLCALSYITIAIGGYCFLLVANESRNNKPYDLKEYENAERTPAKHPRKKTGPYYTRYGQPLSPRMVHNPYSPAFNTRSRLSK